MKFDRISNSCDLLRGDRSKSNSSALIVLSKLRSSSSTKMLRSAAAALCRFARSPSPPCDFDFVSFSVVVRVR